MLISSASIYRPSLPRILPRLLASVATLALLLPATAPAIPLHVVEVTGQAWYRQPGALTWTPLKPERDVDIDTLRVDSNGSAYLSPTPGATIRFGPSAEAIFLATPEHLAQSSQPTIAFRLTHGKITSFTNAGLTNITYQIKTSGGTIGNCNGMFVVCMHGDDSHIFLFRGSLRLYPLHGREHFTGISVQPGVEVGAFTSDGTVKLIPLSRAAAATKNCLLSGGRPEVAAKLETASPNPANLATSPVVSPTQ